jgi:hypothetical protein
MSRILGIAGLLMLAAGSCSDDDCRRPATFGDTCDTGGSTCEAPFSCLEVPWGQTAGFAECTNTCATAADCPESKCDCYGAPHFPCEQGFCRMYYCE